MKEQAPYSILAALENVRHKGRPPIHLWHPKDVKDIDMEIRANGDWMYLGTPIHRQRLIHLFASVLSLDESGDYYLVTPVEKCRIRVIDVPFQAVLMDVSGKDEHQVLVFTTNMAEEVTADAGHQLRFEIDQVTDEPSPYIHVRDGLEARLSRSVYYQIAELLADKVIDDESWMGIWSSGIFFPVIRSADL